MIIFIQFFVLLFTFQTAECYFFDIYDNMTTVEIDANDGNSQDQFGYSVSLWDKYLLIGAPFHDSENESNIGKAYLFNYFVGGRWIYQSSIINDNGYKGEDFGENVVISGSGSGLYAIISAGGSTDSSYILNGYCYTYKIQDSKWIKMNTLTGDDDSNDRFGKSIDISINREYSKNNYNDYDFVIIGAPYDDKSGYTGFYGSAYIYSPNDTNSHTHK